MDANSFAAGVFVGLAGGAVLTGAAWPALRRWQARTARPGVLRTARRRYEQTVPSVATVDPGPWRAQVQAFLYWGERHDFSERRLTRAGVCGRNTTRLYLRLLAGAGVVIVEPRRSPRWGAGWTGPRARAHVRAGRLDIPYPTGRPPRVYTPASGGADVADRRRRSR